MDPVLPQLTHFLLAILILNLFISCFFPLISSLVFTSPSSSLIAWWFKLIAPRCVLPGKGTASRAAAVE